MGKTKDKTYRKISDKDLDSLYRYRTRIEIDLQNIAEILNKLDESEQFDFEK